LKITNVDYQRENGRHYYHLTFNNGWQKTNKKKNFTFQYRNALQKEYKYIVATHYTENGELKEVRGERRNLREPDFGDESNDWTLLKKQTEKEAMEFNKNNGFINEETNAPKKFISTKIY